jgi:hypothetical protein
MTDGWRSRKLWLTLLAMALIVLGFVLCGRPAALYGDYCAAILGASGLFKAANLFEKSRALTVNRESANSGS